MSNPGMLLEILKQLQKKYRCANEMLLHTQEIGEALSRNDMVSIELVLSMRQDEIDKFAKCENDINTLINCLPEEERKEVLAVLKKDFESTENMSPELIKIMERGKNIRAVMKKCVELDKRISKRVAGDDSFYSC